MGGLQLEKAGKYRIENEIGRGAMGVVYLGRDPLIDRSVAIKTIVVPDSNDAEIEGQLTRFRREAQAAGRLNHRNIVTVHDYGEIDNLCYLVMEFVEGRSIAEMVASGERFSINDTLRIIHDVLQAVEYSHRQGVIHRDIKPANILLADDGCVKITDFGVARIESSTLTQSGALLGTPSYMSPEQFTGTPVDQRTDVYSIGIVLYEMLTGDKAFSGSMSVIMQKVLHTELARPSTINPLVPELLDAVVEKAVGKKREQRYATAKQFAMALFEAWASMPEGGAPKAVDPCAATIVDEASDEDATIIQPQPRPTSTGRSSVEGTLPIGSDDASPETRKDRYPVAGQRRKQRLPLLLVLMMISVSLYIYKDRWQAPQPAEPAQPEHTEIPRTLPEKSPRAVPTTTVQKSAEKPKDKPAVATTPIETPELSVPEQSFMLTSNKGPLPSFSMGEELSVFISMGLDAYLYCYYEQHNGSVFRIFPNRYRNDPLLGNGERLQIPDGSMKFHFTFDRPNSVELVHCFAAPQGLLKPLPDALLKEDLVPLEITGIGSVKSAFQEAAGDSLIEKALLIQVK